MSFNFRAKAKKVKLYVANFSVLVKLCCGILEENEALYAKKLNFMSFIAWQLDAQLKLYVAKNSDAIMGGAFV